MCLQKTKETILQTNFILVFTSNIVIVTVCIIINICTNKMPQHSLRRTSNGLRCCRLADRTSREFIYIYLPSSKYYVVKKVQSNIVKLLQLFRFLLLRVHLIETLCQTHQHALPELRQLQRNVGVVLLGITKLFRILFQLNSLIADIHPVEEVIGRVHRLRRHSPQLSESNIYNWTRFSHSSLEMIRTFLSLPLFIYAKCLRRYCRF